MTFDSIARRILPLAAAAVLVAACDDPTIVDAHPEAHGFVITTGAVELVRWMEGDAAPTLSLLAGTTHDVVITLLDEDGLPLPHEDDGNEEEEEEVRVTIIDVAIATWTPEAEPTDHAHEVVEIHGELDALTAGTTTILIELWHGNHPDWAATLTLTVQ